MARHDPQLMIKFARDHLGLAGVVIKMLLLARDLQMSAAREIACNVFFTNDLLHTINARQRCRVHLLRALMPIHGNQFVHP